MSRLISIQGAGLCMPAGTRCDAVSSTVVSLCPHPDSCNMFLFWSCKCPIRRRHETHSIGVKLIHIQEDCLTNALATLIDQVGNILRVIELFTNRIGQNDTCVAPLTNRTTKHYVLPLTKVLIVLAYPP